MLVRRPDERESATTPDRVPLFDHRLTVGRQAMPGQVVLDHPNVSRRHAAFEVVDGAIVLRDLGGTNGIHRRGKRLNNRAESSHVPIRRRDDAALQCDKPQARLSRPVFCATLPRRDVDLVESCPQAFGQLGVVVVCPELHQEQPWLIIQHVVEVLSPRCRYRAT
jgi:hypothetical protein